MLQSLDDAFEKLLIDFWGKNAFLGQNFCSAQESVQEEQRIKFGRFRLTSLQDRPCSVRMTSKVR